MLYTVHCGLLSLFPSAGIYLPTEIGTHGFYMYGNELRQDNTRNKSRFRVQELKNWTFRTGRQIWKLLVLYVRTGIPRRATCRRLLCVYQSTPGLYILFEGV